ncbi:MAG TPA: ferrous iron transporter B [Vicinamibacterales bacterium]|jgi:ferrous iron transport protein B|nr:ferrous iron transporter B [Vicinamibacterales bacterium]
MSCPYAAGREPEEQPLLKLRARPLRIALVGNPNVGKSVVFGRLTGRYATVSNYPGTTVAVTRGRALVGAEVCDVIDTPGVNTFEGAISEDEHITRVIVANGQSDLIVQLADARNLRRALVITSQLAAFQKPVVLVLNMMDEARSRGVHVNAAGLARELGIPVVEMVATEGRGLPELRAALSAATVPAVDTTQPATRWAHETTQRFRSIRRRSLGRFQEWIGRAVREPATGLPLLALVLYVSYLFVGVLGAQTLVGLIEDGLFGGLINPWATSLASHLPWAPVRDFFVGEYGLVTMGLTYALAIVLPVVTTFFLVFGFLEDSGYLPRLAIFSDRLFRAMGLNGKAVLPMVLGLGCDTMATMTTRILHTPKERLIAVLLLALGVPCSAQLATIMGILGGISFAALATLFGVVLTQMLVVGFLAARVLPGDRSEFALELPPMRLPQWRNLLTKTVLRIRWYLGEAVPLFLIGTALLFALDRVGALVVFARTAEPVVSGWLGLPATAADVFVMGFLRRDYGAAGLFEMARSGALTGVQSVVALTVMTLFVPCIANLLMIVKERGARTALWILGFVTAIAVLTGTVLNHAFRILGVTF